VIEGGRPPARRQADHHAALRRAFLSRYDRDEKVASALMGLVPAAEAAGIGRPSRAPLSFAGIWGVSPFPPGSAASGPSTDFLETAAFARAADAFAVAFGLDRLGDAGREQILAWCSRYIRARRSGSAHPSTYGPHRFSTASFPPTFEPDPVGIIGPPWKEEVWDLTHQRRAEVRKRLEERARTHIQATLDQIEAEAKTTGFVFPDTSPKLERDLDWLYQKVRFAKSFQEIYNELAVPPEGGVDSVRRTVVRIAARVGIDTRGW
jgi:hypothetical protein